MKLKTIEATQISGFLHKYGEPKGSDGVISIAAFFGGVSCQH